MQPGCTRRAHCRRISSSEKWRRELTGRESEPSEIIYFNLYKTQIPVVEQAIETTALMLGTDKSRGYGLEMICADFPAGAKDPTTLLESTSRFFKFLPGEQRQAFLHELPLKLREANSTEATARVDPEPYDELRKLVLRRDGWRCQLCGSRRNLQVHHKQLRSQQGSE